MELELDVHPDDIAPLLKPRGLDFPRIGRARGRVVGRRWYDGGDGELVRRGLALSEQGDVWTLERSVPRKGFWPPGAPAPVLETALDRLLLGTELPRELVSVAEFAGTETTWSVTVGTEIVVLRMVRGEVPSDPIARKICRLTVSGDDGAVLAVARAIATRYRALPPDAAIAARARAAAGGDPPEARHLGPPNLPETDDPTVGQTFRHVLGQLTDVILYWAPLAAGGQNGPEPVHQIRVAVRRARSVVTAFREVLGGPALETATAGLRTLGTCLGPARDWDVFLGETAPTIGAQFPGDSHLAALCEAAEHHRRESHAALTEYLGGAAFRLTCVELAWLAGSDRWYASNDPLRPAAADMPLAEFAPGIVQKRWKKLLSAGKHLERLDIPALHGLRLRAKRTRYAAEIVADLYPGKTTERFLRRLSALQATLGVLNDGAVAHGLMGRLGGADGPFGYAVGVVLGYTAAASATIRPDIALAWRKFRRQSAFWG